ncbi:hypothetical protein IWW55_000439 [Coemansia sp. RSA 2706]|nr:hypothetical protein IWW55_000439 [Coemansia sp. RSA 2706]KAJ2312297.1 hypothetical protein IWW54_002172 [Coemansia sp. RSA 2705]KAJ2320711.1 hypothetical protein IWW52_001198 [Coemansia sp. RSA 2704]KAJ2329378.1 hypothetical protein IWW51_000642 [Coemansia sp. RSA 2702]KAJ2738499.1 hypothetical protein H4R23_001106 [Coemansia sp. Cherry 401B]
MDALTQYASSDSDSDSEQRTYAAPVVRQYTINTAPDIIGSVPAQHELARYVGHDQREIKHNMTYAELGQPLLGPLDSEGEFNSKQTTTASGTAEHQAIDETTFRKQERMFRQQGVASDPSIGADGQMVGAEATKRQRRKRAAKGDAAVLDGENAYQGPWAKFEGDTTGQTSGPTAEQLAEYEERMAQTSGSSGPQRVKRGSVTAYVAGQDERTLFHGQHERDYQGRTYMHVPAELRATNDVQCRVPTRLVREWKAHQGGVSAIRFIPGSGHLLLSCGMDGLVKLFDVHSALRQQRTYIGHAKAVRDISFAPDGQTFVSSSYDTFSKIWDTETGACKQRLAAGSAVPYVARFYPDDPNSVLVGQGDRRIVQWDVRANQVVQEYNQHQGAINSLTFFDDNRRFVSTSDDKSMRVWEYGIPVVIKLVADPAMHSVPAVALHPNGKWLTGQSMDNRVVVYSTGDRFKIHRRKEFRGHVTAGFACQPAISPDGRVVVSGDAEGGVWCWDWQTSRVLGRWRAHDKVAIGAAWHPREASRVATCSWDGSIKYWE